MIELLLEPEVWLIFLTLFGLELILGVDNVVFISVLCERLPVHQRAIARNLGIGLAVLARVGLVFSISWVMSLTYSLFQVSTVDISGRDLILIGGGAFLLAKSVSELKHLLLVTETDHAPHLANGLTVVLLQIVAMDTVFSMDSVITAVGLTDDLPIMVAAILASAVFMVLMAGAINRLVTKHPGLKALALLFLVLLGGLLMAEGFEIHINKGYVYFAMAFGLLLEIIHIQLSKKIKAAQERRKSNIRYLNKPTRPGRLENRQANRFGSLANL
ncbi:TerC family protein [Pseudovibrio brasiliensis]|uniref:TerC family protein n=1 Tax=Pseudovibrio brasiliensis TaxID=1898042 RepID=A0ABX8ATQ1_9HYPH|nr:TerC family protein [Pseudovibrio brasiliensis]QUS58490.1 TerC family protein [Pseudovibrio brasiliensis]